MAPNELLLPPTASKEKGHWARACSGPTGGAAWVPSQDFPETSLWLGPWGLPGHKDSCG